jgi:hypothetical protein
MNQKPSMSKLEKPITGALAANLRNSRFATARIKIRILSLCPIRLQKPAQFVSADVNIAVMGHCVMAAMRGF